MIKLNGSTILSVGGLCAALVGTCGYLRTANAIMLAANLTVIGSAGYRRWRGATVEMNVSIPVGARVPVRPRELIVSIDPARGDDAMGIVAIDRDGRVLTARAVWPKINPLYRQG